MVETLIITLREGLESVLILFAMISAVRSKKSPHLQKAIWIGTALAIVLSFVAVLFLPTILAFLHVNEEAYEGFLYLIGAFFILTLFIWINRHKGWAGEARAHIEKASGSRFQTLALGLIAFLLIFREAFETLVFMGAIGFTTPWLSQLIGWITGVVFVCMFGFFFFRGHRWLPIQHIFRLTQVLLAILILQFTVTGIHELIEAEIIPGGPREMAMIGPIVNHDFLFFSFLLLVAMVWMLIRSHPKVHSTDSSNASSAQKRLERAQRKRLHRWRIGLSLVVVLSAGFLMGFYIVTRPPSTEPAEILTPQGSTVYIPANNLPEDHIVFYAIDLGDANIKIFLLKHRNKVIPLLDACLLCGRKGYYQRGRTVICRNCSSPITLDTIGVEGGCNPIPLPYTRRNNTIILKVADIKHIVETELPD